ncbi:protein jag [Priestia megaterium]|nr:protein jag [Priestia megaterium]
MKEITVTGQTVDEAIDEALSQLNIEKNQATIEVIEKGKKGFLGIFKGKPAIVRVEKMMNPVDEAVKYIIDVSQQMGVQIETRVNKTSRQCEIEISSESAGLLIGKHGQTINALQLLTQLVANRYSKHYLTIVLNPEGYRERREEALAQLALKLAKQVLQTNKSIQLEAMPSHERKVIHQVLAKNKAIETTSIGKEPKRSVLIQSSVSKKER